MNILKKLLIFSVIIFGNTHAMDKGMYEFTFNNREIKQPGLYEEAVLEHSSYITSWKQKKDVMLGINAQEYEEFFKELFRVLPRTVTPPSAHALREAFQKIRYAKLSKVAAALGLEQYVYAKRSTPETFESSFADHQFDPNNL